MQKITRPTSSHLGQTSLVNKGFIIRTKNTILLWNTACIPRGHSGGGAFISTQSSSRLIFFLVPHFRGKGK